MSITHDRPNRSDYVSARGLRRDGLPMRLWEKAVRLVWDPSEIDFSQDVAHWADLDDRRRAGLGGQARGFMVGEEAVTLDILPLLRAISDEGRLEETMYLTTFAFEEAKHVDFFTRWFDAVGCDPRELETAVPRAADYGGSAVIDDELPRVMQRLDGDRSAQAVLDAALTYNQFVEAVLAIVGYRIWERIFTRRDILPGFQQGLKLVQRDERRHIAYGTYLCRRIIAADHDLWSFVEQRMHDLTEMALDTGGQAAAAYGDRFQQYADLVRAQAARRLAVLRPATTLTPERVEADTEDTLVPDLG